jgi:hypothetical protein
VPAAFHQRVSPSSGLWRPVDANLASATRTEAMQGQGVPRSEVTETDFVLEDTKQRVRGRIAQSLVETSLCLAKGEKGPWEWVSLLGDMLPSRC